MVIVRNAKKTGDIVEFDYYPENKDEKGYIKYNYKTREILSIKKTSFDDCMNYVGHARVAVNRCIDANLEIPQEICEMWY